MKGSHSGVDFLTTQQEFSTGSLVRKCVSTHWQRSSMKEGSWARFLVSIMV